MLSRRVSSGIMTTVTTAYQCHSRAVVLTILFWKLSLAVFRLLIANLCVCPTCDYEDKLGQHFITHIRMLHQELQSIPHLLLYILLLILTYCITLEICVKWGQKILSVGIVLSLV
jgi:hypothetical protein